MNSKQVLPHPRAGRLVATVFLALAAACSTGRLPDTSATSAEALRAMTFNIRYGTAPDSNNAWPHRRGLTFRVIDDFAPIVLGVQEALRFQLDEIERQLPHFSEIGVGRDDGMQKGEYAAILYDRRRLEVIDQGTFWLSDTPDVPGSMTWGNKYPRIVTWARFRERTNGSAFYVFNTHWDHESQPARERGALLLLERIRARPAPTDPVIVMGDFNAGPSNPAFQQLLTGAVRLYDTILTLHPNATRTGTYHGFRGNRSGEKIDAILASPEWATLAAEIILLSENGVYPSDHFPVTATLLLLGPSSRN
ncbi:MAG: endonuclease/exonuclease/phosphatase family protein [Gemmatimonadota bacterium]